MSEEKPTSDVRIPRQRRSRERVEAILEAAKALIGEKGSAGLKIQEIADRAGVTAGSMYQYFPNKAAILHALAEQYLDQFYSLLETSLSERPATLEESVEALQSLLDQFYHVNVNDPVLRDIWQSISVDKTLRDMDIRGSRRNAEIVFDSIRHLFPEEHEADVQRYCLLIAHIFPPIIRLALTSDADESPALLESAKRMIETSLLGWIGD